MMIDKYEELYQEYKSFINNKSTTNTKIVKYNSNTSAFFPLISFKLSNITDTNNITLKKIEFYNNMYITVDIYTKDVVKTITSNGEEVVKTYSSNTISKELVELTILFFQKKNFYMSSCRPTPNLDTNIMRTTMQFQASVGNLNRLKTIRR